VHHSDEEWARLLTDQQRFVLRDGGTEAPNSSPLARETRTGVFRCAGCGAGLFASSAKFESRTGWPTFAEPLAPKALEVGTGNSRSPWLAEAVAGARFRCAACGSSVGERFSDGAAYPGTPAVRTGKRYCANGAALVFESSEGGGALVVGDAPGNAPLNGRRDYEWRMRDGGLRSI
jgi:peptide-methionine (R)-S-oxide reductase